MLELVERRVHYLLRECGGHCAVRLRTHVLVLRLRPQAQEDGQRLLPHLQEDNQRHHQDLPQRIVGVCKLVCVRRREFACVRVCVCAVVNQSHVMLFVKAGVSLVRSMVAQVQKDFFYPLHWNLHRKLADAALPTPLESPPNP